MSLLLLQLWLLLSGIIFIISLFCAIKVLIVWTSGKNEVFLFRSKFLFREHEDFYKTKKDSILLEQYIATGLIPLLNLILPLIIIFKKIRDKNRLKNLPNKG